MEKVFLSFSSFSDFKLQGSNDLFTLAMSFAFHFLFSEKKNFYFIRKEKILDLVGYFLTASSQHYFSVFTYFHRLREQFWDTNVHQ